MPLIELNSQPVVTAQVRMSRTGVWNADLVVQAEQNVVGPVTFSTKDGSFSLRGVSFREGVFTGSLSLRLIGGAGGLAPPPSGLGQLLAPRSYINVSVRTVVTDLVRECGETLSTTVSATLLSKRLQRWVRLGGQTGKDALNTLLKPLCDTWRVLPDGSIWFGNETWPAVAKRDFQVIDWHFGEGWMRIASDQPFCLPGQSITLPLSATGGSTENQVQRISALTHDITPSSIETILWFLKGEEAA